MKRSSSLSNATGVSTASLSKHGHLAWLVLWLLSLLMTACASPPPIPHYFEPLAPSPTERIPIKTVLVHDQQIAYLDVGTGPPVILIHGFGGSMWQWEHQQQALSQHFRTLTLDLPGSGLSDKPDIDYLPNQMLDYCLGFMDALEISHATLIGNSMGAGLAIGMALSHPTRVDKLVLIGGLPSQVMAKLTSRSFRQALETRAPWWLVSFGNWLFGGMVTDSVLKEIVHDHTLLTPAVVDRSNLNRRRPGVIKPILAMRNALPSWETDFAPHLASIAHPTMIIWGESDRVFPIAVGEELHHRIRTSTFVSIPNAGHMPQWERPELVNRSLITYIHTSP
ncbi:MAG: alpha/beta fold hydrolase [Nitrospira sp.]|nr:alpha/beta fold hydrolase [Nitrospira sp.]